LPPTINSEKPATIASAGTRSAVTIALAHHTAITTQDSAIPPIERKRERA